MFKGRHRLNLSWLTLMVALGVGFHKLKGMAKLAPAHITEYRFRRLLSAVYWSIQEIMLFMVRSVLDVLPKPEDSTLYSKATPCQIDQ